MNWKLKLLPAGLLAVLGALAGASPAAAWDVVGQQAAEGTMDTAEDGTTANHMIRVRGHRQYRQIKLCVYRNPMYFGDLRINLRNGRHQDVTIRSQINAGECTRVIDLEGGARDIQSIELFYDVTNARAPDYDGNIVRRPGASVRVYAQ